MPALVYFRKFLFNYGSIHKIDIFHGKKVCINFEQKWAGLHFGRFFSQTHLVALCRRARRQEAVSFENTFKAGRS
jgi:hypothetical protein